MKKYLLNPRVRIFQNIGNGGIAFNPDNVIKIEIDSEVLKLLKLLIVPIPIRELRNEMINILNRNLTLSAIDIILKDLSRLGFIIEVVPDEESNFVFDKAIDEIPFYLGLESVHLALNYNCNQKCPSCYIDKSQKSNDYLSLNQILAFIDDIRSIGVMQLAIGGGEPLLSENLISVVHYAFNQGIIPNITTNGTLINQGFIRKIASYIGEIRLSLNDGITANFSMLTQKIDLLNEYNVRFGFNLIVTHNNIELLEEYLTWSCNTGASTVNLIRPKPSREDSRWYKNNVLTSKDYERLQALLADMEPLFNKTNLTIDCAFSFLLYGQEEDDLNNKNALGCAIGKSFCAVSPNGKVYPCSHLISDDFILGNISIESLKTIWKKSSKLKDMRKKLNSLPFQCGQCTFSSFCKGCRAISHLQRGDWLMPDKECPNNFKMAVTNETR